MATRTKNTTNPTANTQGREGMKAKRINMAFTDENYEFLQLVARGAGWTMTQLVNTIIDDYRQRNTEITKSAQGTIAAIHETLGGGNE